MDNVTLVIPTYNERDNIAPFLDALLEQQQNLPQVRLTVLVVDDYSADGTAEIVEQYVKKHGNIHLLQGQKQGLGVAYIRGFRYAMAHLSPDVAFEMDADFSHDPKDIPRLLAPILEQGRDFVIGSRYIEHGSIPAEWPLYRRLNSKWGNVVARRIAGLGRVKDCTSGFRAIRTSLLSRIDLDRLGAKGYSFQMNLLFYALEQNADVAEVPIHFKDRDKGESKMRFADIREFVLNAFTLRWWSFSAWLNRPLFWLSAGLVSVMLVLFAFNRYGGEQLLMTTILSLSLILSAQSLFTLFLMLYAWEDPARAKTFRSPAVFLPPINSFTALIPARHGEAVIGDTIRAVAQIEYPEAKKEALVICRSDDTGTIQAAEAAIAALGVPNIRVAVFAGDPVNKPHGLNFGLKQANHDIVVIFDAEDEPHPEIYRVADTVLQQKKADVVQSGVQLMNFQANWFSTLNVLEYFFWFKSSLQFFARAGMIPLGGNTVFFRKELLEKVGGWGQNCLTEDADIGLRLSRLGAKTVVVYDEKHVTREETPPTLKSFIKQRTRWNQGFLQILGKGEWRGLPTLKQRLLALYVFFSPQLQALLFVLVPLSVLMIFTVRLPVWLAMLSMLPLYLLALQFVLYNVGLFEFTRAYRLRYPFWLPLKMLVTYFPFQLMLGLSAFRAVQRSLARDTDWEKTEHLNAHRINITARSAPVNPVYTRSVLSTED